ncbi:Gfo/Idh/MocA family oxidoreductase [bacterium]|nr:Gfo/Idh/MocA family oxidoreductase [bacterium]
MKFLIAGLGSIGRRHLRNLVALGERDILLYRTHKSTLPDEELDGFPVVIDLEAALAHKPDAVIVANPTALHLDVAIPAAMAGCHLLLEKPVAGELNSRVKTLQKVVAGSGVKTLVGFQFRFHPILRKIRDLIQTEQLGRPLSFRAHWGEYLPDWHPWEDYRQGYAARADLGGGVVNTLSHPLDYVRWLFGEVASVTALTGHISDLGLDVEDTAEIALGFTSGLIGSVHLDYVQRPPSHWLTINFEKGQVRWDNATGQAKVYAVNLGEWETLSPPGDFERNQLFLEEIRHFIALIRGGVDSRCSLGDGVRALQMTEAVHQSVREGFAVKL